MARKMEVGVSELKRAVEFQHGGTATFVQTLPIHESHEGQTVWNGSVHIFDLTGHPSANRAYAWSAQVEGTNKRRFFTVLHAPPINGPRDAVRAAIVAEARCPACAGTGDQPLYDIVPGPTPPPILPCKECSGTGKIYRD